MIAPRVVLMALLALAVLPAFAEDAKPAEATGDLKKMQGQWSAKFEGLENKPTVYTFRGDKLTIKGETRTYEITIKLDESAKPAKTVDFHIDKAPDDAQGQTSKGIYKFEGDDKLIVCFRPEGDRPDKFEQVGFEIFLSTLTRKPTADAK